MDGFIIIVLFLKSIRYLIYSIKGIVYKNDLILFSHNLGYGAHYIFLLFSLLLFICTIIIVLKMKKLILLSIMSIYFDIGYSILALIYLMFRRTMVLSGGLYFIYLLIYVYIIIVVDLFIISRLDKMRQAEAM
jgi:hypothetical protein